MVLHGVQHATLRVVGAGLLCTSNKHSRSPSVILIKRLVCSSMQFLVPDSLYRFSR